MALLPETLQSPFDRRAYPNYIMIAGMSLFGLSLMLVRGFTIAPEIAWEFFSWALVVIISGLAARRLGWERLAGALESIGVIYWQGLAGLLCIVPLATFAPPLADHFLNGIDKALSFDWVAYANLTQPLKPPFVIAYKSFIWQPALVLGALFFSRHFDRGWQLVQAATIGLIPAIALFAFFPAVSAYNYHGGQPSYIQPVVAKFLPVLMELRDGRRILDEHSFAGMITFPSYHAAAAVMFAWAAWPLKWLRWPLIALNLVVLAATVSIGSHYLIDVIGGVGLGGFAIRSSKALQSHWLKRQIAISGNGRGSQGVPGDLVDHRASGPHRIQL